MLALDQVDRTTFTLHLGETFEAVFTDRRLPLTLAEIRPLGTAHSGAAHAHPGRGSGPQRVAEHLRAGS